MNFKTIIFTLIMTFSTLTLAEVAPESFVGTFKTGACSASAAQTATITLLNAQSAAPSLMIRFNEENGLLVEVMLTTVATDYVEIKATQESFTVTNEYFLKVADGLILPSLKVRLAKSATGNRVRLNTTDYLSNINTECVLYRN